MKLSKLDRRRRIQKRIRKIVKGTAQMPRLSVFRSNKEIYAQIIDDVNGVTLAAASSREKEIASSKGTKIETAALVGEKIAKIAIDKGINSVTFDRSGFLYHGRVKSLAEGARIGGVKF
jgi:large subunit ribosomal protein L18